MILEQKTESNERLGDMMKRHREKANQDMREMFEGFQNSVHEEIKINCSKARSTKTLKKQLDLAKADMEEAKKERKMMARWVEDWMRGTKNRESKMKKEDEGLGAGSRIKELEKQVRKKEKREILDGSSANERGVNRYHKMGKEQKQGRDIEIDSDDEL